MEATLTNRKLMLGAAAGAGAAALAIAGVCAQPALASQDAQVWLDCGNDITLEVGQKLTVNVMTNINPAAGTYTYVEDSNALIHRPLDSGNNFVNGRTYTKSAVDIEGNAKGTGTLVANYTNAASGKTYTLTLTAKVKAATKTVKKAQYKATSRANVTYVKPTAKKSTKKLTVPATVKINDASGCKVTSVAAKAFKGYKKLTKVTIGKNVKKIGSKAFTGCKKLKTLTINSKKLTKKGVKNALKGSSITKVKVPKSKVKAYKKIFTKANCGKSVKVVKK